MRTERQIQQELDRLGNIMTDQNYAQEQRDQATAMVIALCWARNPNMPEWTFRKPARKVARRAQRKSNG